MAAVWPKTTKAILTASKIHHRFRVSLRNGDTSFCVLTLVRIGFWIAAIYSKYVSTLYHQNKQTSNANKHYFPEILSPHM